MEKEGQKERQTEGGHPYPFKLESENAESEKGDPDVNTGNNEDDLERVEEKVRI